ncbi:MAG: hypothetical protein ACK5Y7_03660 [Betaproteobacteria bacterium]|jgi:hypothetical protein
MAKPNERLRGFAVLIQPYPGFTLQELRELERRIEDYAEAHEIEMSGHHLTFTVSSPQRSLTATDQVDLVDWLTGQPGISAMRLTPLRDRPDASTPEEDGFLVVPACDTVTIGLKLLYRARRISAEMYLQILGGFVRSVHVH